MLLGGGQDGLHPSIKLNVDPQLINILLLRALILGSPL